MPDTAPAIVLREVLDADLHQFFEHLRDPQAVAMGPFTAEDPNDRQSFDAHWRRLRRNPEVTVRTIALADDPERLVVGHILHFVEEGQPQVSYWIGREHWGRGIATTALAMLLREVPERPVWARAARHNRGSLMVLQRNGFVIVGQDTGYAPDRGRMIDELVLRLA
ncbi:MAG: GNAT family N-acetyltransferase [Actinomycetales bacterium]|nr:GNAT family N-acetyltransferase [Actinomycetales bacterium]